MGRPRRPIAERLWRPETSHLEAKPEQRHDYLYDAKNEISQFESCNNGGRLNFSASLPPAGRPSTLNEEGIPPAVIPISLTDSSQNPDICLCMTIILSALNALSSCPADTEDAIRIARSGSMALREVMISPCCGIIGERSTLNNVLKSRNVYTVCMLVPTIVKAFSRALSMVDSEVSSAQMEERTLNFDIRRLGGLSKALQRAHSTCEDSRKELPAEPDEWRVLVRVLLRADIYGYHPSDEGLQAREPDSHLGLWEAILGLEKLLKEEKSGDSLVRAEGQDDIQTQIKLVSKDHVELLQVLALAQTSLETLVIA